MLPPSRDYGNEVLCYPCRPVHALELVLFIKTYRVKASEYLRLLNGDRGIGGYEDDQIRQALYFRRTKTPGNIARGETYVNMLTVGFARRSRVTPPKVVIDIITKFYYVRLWHFKIVTYHRDFPYLWGERYNGWEQGWTSDDEYDDKIRRFERLQCGSTYKCERIY